MDTEARNESLSKFKQKENNILVVTDLCARGIDIPNIGTVINFDFPISLKVFIHRCGRTARAGKKGRCFSFFSPEEKPYVYELEKHITKQIVNV